MEHISDVLEKGQRGGKRRQAQGRKDAAKQEKKIEMAKLEEKLQHLVNLHTECKEASTNFSDAIKATAEASGLTAKVVRQFVSAKAGENFGDRKRDAEQLALVFDEIAG